MADSDLFRASNPVSSYLRHGPEIVTLQFGRWTDPLGGLKFTIIHNILDFYCVVNLLNDVSRYLKSLGSRI